METELNPRSARVRVRSPYSRISPSPYVQTLLAGPVLLTAGVHLSVVLGCPLRIAASPQYQREVFTGQESGQNSTETDSI